MAPSRRDVSTGAPASDDGAFAWLARKRTRQHPDRASSRSDVRTLTCTQIPESTSWYTKVQSTVSTFVEHPPSGQTFPGQHVSLPQREVMSSVMNALLRVLQLADGNYAVQSIGGAALNSISGKFSTQAEAEGAMMRQMLSSRSDAGIMRPGDGLGVA